MRALVTGVAAMSSVSVSGGSAVGLAPRLRFSRARCGGGVFVLWGVPVVAWRYVLSFLFLRGAVFVSAGCSLSSRRCWVAFRCGSALAGLLALRVPCPAGVAPLLVSARSGALLSGAAAARAGAGALVQRSL